jgi:3-hydroxyisobutyrate dehydrogenase-like beta-hydroxyacid dehydrogenase
MRMRVGFIGLGAIGWPMAGTLVKAGHDVLAFDLDRERLKRFGTEFACPLASGLAMAERDFVVTMLPTGDIVREVPCIKRMQRSARPCGPEHW